MLCAVCPNRADYLANSIPVCSECLEACLSDFERELETGELVIIPLNKDKDNESETFEPLAIPNE